MKTIRSFLACKINLETIRGVSEEQRQLRGASADTDLRVSWVSPTNMHVTIRFLGDITEPMVHAVQDALRDPVGREAPFEVQVAGIGAFPDANRPRVVWAGVADGDDRLSRLHGIVNTGLEAVGFPAEKRPFRSHITIGRVKAGPSEALTAAIGESADKTFGGSTINELVCYRSDLQPRGAEYRALWAIRLRGRPPAAREEGPSQPHPGRVQENDDQ